jgi:hypothetical protein
MPTVYHRLAHSAICESSRSLIVQPTGCHSERSEESGSGGDRFFTSFRMTAAIEDRELLLQGVALFRIHGIMYDERRYVR